MHRELQIARVRFIFWHAVIQNKSQLCKNDLQPHQIWPLCHNVIFNGLVEYNGRKVQTEHFVLKISYCSKSCQFDNQIDIFTCTLHLLFSPVNTCINRALLWNSCGVGTSASILASTLSHELLLRFTSRMRSMDIPSPWHGVGWIWPFFCGRCCWRMVIILAVPSLELGSASMMPRVTCGLGIIMRNVCDSVMKNKIPGYGRHFYIQCTI